MAYVFEQSHWQLRTERRTWALRDFVQNRVRPFYLYDLDGAVLRARRYLSSGARVHYAMKANSHPRLLRALARAGCGADVVSLGELQLALRQGFEPQKIIFSGVGKGRDALDAALALNIYQINVESFEELKLLNEVAQARGARASFALRVNIHLEAPTHKHVQTATESSKFGLDVRLLPEVLQWLKGKSALELRALAVHIGSQILDISVFEEMAGKMGALYRDVRAQGFGLGRLDLGGGLGLDYRDANADDAGNLDQYIKRVMPAHGTDAQIIFEPGRYLVARMGVLLAKVVHVKTTATRRFVILDAGMNALMRPALYEAYHRIEPIQARAGAHQTYTVVGPICESTDVFGYDRELSPVEAGDWVGLFDAGAYGAAMANTYNEMPFPDQISVLEGEVEIL